MNKIRLGVNIDHICTVRNARGGNHPDPLRASQIAKKAGADLITAHLREDRRHITDDDLEQLKKNINLPLNMEMAATPEMLRIAKQIKPQFCCIVPEKRQELTTEGGLDVVGNLGKLQDYINELAQSNIKTSLFIDPDLSQIKAAKICGATAIEIHTGSYCSNFSKKQHQYLEQIKESAVLAKKLGLHCHAGHGLTYESVIEIAKIPEIEELNIGHFLIGEAIFLGLEKAIKKMIRIINNARNK